ncbi:MULTISPECIES: GH25 family lysozyme [unclassified Roseitalea]|uniref:glycoside hydrolase family 25 protein n=1 Tax=unclassified Roseitalea TaxID=2639107 RepID=UPI00273F74A3|nr:MULTISPECIES: GH25 family lysozyme [unclassified Roseitalea]
MRSLLLAVGLFAVTSAGLAGCTSSSRVDALTTAATEAAPAAPVTDPAAPIGGVAALIAETRQDFPPPLDAPKGKASGKAADTKAAPVPAPIEVALARPENPALSVGRIYPPRFGDAEPVDFGARSPHPFEVHGVDVSHWQQEIDWKALRTQGANFAFIKATEGGKHVDRLFKRNWDQARKAGIPRGAYHFFYWCRAASEQADWFIRHVPREKGSLPPVLDVEWYGNKGTCPKKPSRATVLEKMQVFLDRLEAHYGVKPIIYTTPDFYRDNLRGRLTDYSFWLRSVAAHPSDVYPDRAFAFWQYSGTGTARKGVKTKIDLNVFNGTEEGWRRWLAERVVR